MLLRLSLLFAVCLASLALTGNALASGGNYVFAGGSPAERATVRAALQASAFPWSAVPNRITIHIGKGFPSDASRSEIWLDSRLLDAGSLSWGTILHEYGHQVDYFLLDDAKRAALAPALGGRSWWPRTGLRHSDVTSERFASTLAWSYWPNAANTMKPEGRGDESAALSPAGFRALLARVLGIPDRPATAPPQTAPSSWKAAQPAAKPAQRKAKHRKARKNRPKVSGARRSRR